MKRTPLNKVSKKKLVEKKKEQKLTQELLELCKGLCMNCGSTPDFRGLSKHEIKFRSQGGDPTDRNNTILVCGKCHSKFHGITEV
jgi:5-methylcytosine-specific restriction endonuclease McrA